MIVNNGRTEFFTGAGTEAVSANIKFIRVLEAAVFDTLVMMFTRTPASTDAADPADVTFPPLSEIWDVKSFQLASGSIQVFYKD